MSTPVVRAYDGAAVVISAHHDAAQLPACLRGVLTAALCVPIPVAIVVVLDANDDGSAALAGEYGPDVHFIGIDFGIDSGHDGALDDAGAGTARAVGFAYARSLFSDGADCWYALTDPGRRVDPAWLVRQLQFGTDMVCEDRPTGLDMGFSARAYWRVGGLCTPAHSSSAWGAADHRADLVARFEAAGYRVHRDSGLSLITSARTRARAHRGFAHHLGEPRRSAAGDCA